MSETPNSPIEFVRQWMKLQESFAESSGILHEADQGPPASQIVEPETAPQDPEGSDNEVDSYSKDAIDARFDALRHEFRGDLARIEGSLNASFERIGGDIRALTAGLQERGRANEREMDALKKDIGELRESIKGDIKDQTDASRFRIGTWIAVAGVILAALQFIQPIIQSHLAPSSGHSQIAPAPVHS